MFVTAGLNVLVFDNRNFGASDGEPRQEIDPVAQVRDYRHAITWACGLPEVDPLRIGVWGSSYSGGHVLAVAATDRRVKTAVSQVPLVSGSANLRALVRADLIAGLRAAFDADRAARYGGAAPTMVPVVSEDLFGAAALPTPDSWAWFTETARARAPSWKNEVTLRSIESFTEYEPGSYIRFISPSPFALYASLFFLIMAVVGGLTNIWGGLFGAAAVTVLDQVIRAQVPRVFPRVGGEYQTAIYGVLLVVIMIFFPRGLVRGAIDLRRAQAHPLPVPGGTADAEPAEEWRA